MLFQNAWSSTGDQNAFSFLVSYWRDQNPLYPYERYITLLFGEPDHCVQSVLNRELWSTMDKTMPRHNINHRKMSASLNLLLQYKISFLFSIQQLQRCISKHFLLFSFFHRKRFPSTFTMSIILCVL